MKYPTDKRKDKRCIGEKTEINVASNYDINQIHGLFLGHDGKGLYWGNNYKYWDELRHFGFPAAKISMFDAIKEKRGDDLMRCTLGFGSWTEQAQGFLAFAVC